MVLSVLCFRFFCILFVVASALLVDQCSVRIVLTDGAGKGLILLLVLLVVSQRIIGLGHRQIELCLGEGKIDRCGAGFYNIGLFAGGRGPHRRILKNHIHLHLVGVAKDHIGQLDVQINDVIASFGAGDAVGKRLPCGGTHVVAQIVGILPRLGHGGVFAGPVAQVQGHIHPAVVGFNLLPFLILIDDAGAVKTNQIRFCRMGEGPQQISVDVIKGQIRLTRRIDGVLSFYGRRACHGDQHTAHHAYDHQDRQKQAHCPHNLLLFHLYSPSSLSVFCGCTVCCSVGAAFCSWSGSSSFATCSVLVFVLFSSCFSLPRIGITKSCAPSSCSCG